MKHDRNEIDHLNRLDDSDASCISFDGVSFSYSENAPILSKLSLSFLKDGITSILGPNGVGKTTILNIALGWLQPATGTVSLFGRDVRTIPRREIGRTISLVPQDEHIPFEYSLLDYVLLGRSPYLHPLESPGNDDRERAIEALHVVGLAARHRESVHEMSGGEKHLVLFARSLCQDPRILVLDEPAAHLDLANKRRLVDNLHALRDRSDVSIVCTTHDPDFAAVVSDAICLIPNGNAAIYGRPGEILTSSRLSSTFGIPLSVSHHDDHVHIIW